MAQWEEEFCLPFYRDGWADFSIVYRESQKIYSGCVSGGEIVDFGGVISASCGGPWAGLNLAFVSQPVRSAERFRPRLGRALTHFRERGIPWLLVVPNEWVAPGQHEQIASLLYGLGFQTAMEAEALTAIGRSESMPMSLNVEQALHARHWAAIAAINAQGWGVPPKWTEPLLMSTAFQNKVRGWLGFLNGVPVCAAVTHDVLGHTFVAWVATLPDCRKRGFAGALVRWAISQDDCERQACVISGPQAVSAYLAAGFTRRERLRLYLAPS